MIEILEFSLSGGFWHFIGCMLLIVIVCEMIIKTAYAIFTGHRIVKKDKE